MLTSKNKTIFFLLTFLCTAAFLFPFINYPNVISQGDHGRDLHLFEKTSKGSIPIKDCKTDNGPLMPYYYSLVYKVFGINLQTTAIGYNFLVLGTTLLIFLISAYFLSPPFSFLCSMWYLIFRQKEFFYTFNHIGAVFFIASCLYFLFSFCKKTKIRDLFLLSASILLLSLIRPNMAIACAFVSTLILLIHHFKNNTSKNLYKFYTLPLLSLALSHIVYFFLTSTVKTQASIEHIYLNSVQIEHVITFPMRLFNLLVVYYNSSWRGLCVLFLTIACGLWSFILFKKNIFSENEKKEACFIFLALSLFFAGLLGEFLFSDLWFRFYWALIPFFMIQIYIIYLGISKSPQIVKTFVWIVLFAAIITGAINNHPTLKSSSVILNDRSKEINLLKKQSDWATTVNLTTSFLKSQLNENETFLCFPYCPLYNYLTEHDTVNRQHSFFNISGEKEKQLIADLEIDQTRFIILENRAYFSLDPRFGILNETYGFNFEKYLVGNYTLAAQFGPWDSPVGWANDHATKIYKRK
jgi:hypothetical protein